MFLAFTMWIIQSHYVHYLWKKTQTRMEAYFKPFNVIVVNVSYAELHFMYSGFDILHGNLNIMTNYFCYLTPLLNECVC